MLAHFKGRHALPPTPNNQPTNPIDIFWRLGAKKQKQRANKTRKRRHGICKFQCQPHAAQSEFEFEFEYEFDIQFCFIFR